MGSPLRALPVVLAFTGLAAAACGGGGSSSAADDPSLVSPAATASTPTTPPVAQPTTVTLRSGRLGRFLTDTQGRSLYLFEADRSLASVCSGSCAQAWPPLTTRGVPVAGAGVRPALLGVFRRADGSQQVAYNGHPLYYYVGDGAVGQTQGQGLNQFGAKWYVLSPSGLKIDTD
jgi:predicted lipoprotein with Yx(FWY)xxD motif